MVGVGVGEIISTTSKSQLGGVVGVGVFVIVGVNVFVGV